MNPVWTSVRLQFSILYKNVDCEYVGLSEPFGVGESEQEYKNRVGMNCPPDFCCMLIIIYGVYLTQSNCW
jgi:hypothetical protein